jgi:2-oxoisovalerate dehydrogenase E1 component
MATETRHETEAPDLAGLSAEQLLRFYRTMITARAVDDREISLKRQNKIFFQISGAGHEAIGVAVAEHTRPGKDWFYFYYRDRAFALALGQTPLDHLLQAVGAEDDPSSGGRQMPGHYGDPRYNIMSTSSPTGTQFLQAVGSAEAGLRALRIPELQEHVGSFHEDELVVCTTGDGTTSEGEFWEALNTASNLKLPVLFIVEDNGYAISVPVEVQTAGGSVSKLVQGFPDLLIRECDGTDVVDTYRTAGELVAHCRARKGPALLHAHCTRPYSHSMSDDERMYRTAAEIDAQKERDCLTRTRALILGQSFATEEELDALEAEARQAVSDAADEALSHDQPEPETAMRHLFSEEVDPTSPAFDSEDAPEYAEDRTLTMVDLLNACMRDEMERDPRIVVFGEDVADASREEVLDEVKGKGGVFKVTHGLQARFGGDRVYNSPLAEANIVGRAIGMAVAVDAAGNLYVGGKNRTIKYGPGGLQLWAVDCGSEVVLDAHCPGLHVVMPSNAEDANGLLRTAMRCEDPVLFLEHKHLYRQVYNKGRNPGRDFMIPLGKAKVVREGSDLTVVTCGALVKRTLDAAKQAQDQHGISAEVIDLRTIWPLDMDTIARSVKKTNKVLVTHEDAVSFGFGAEIAARIADDLFPYLDGPVRRVGAMDTWVAYAPQLEEVILPQTPRVLEAMLELAGY